MSRRLSPGPVTRRVLGSIGLLVLAAACSQADDANTSVGFTQQAIVDGVDDVDTPEANTVVRLNNNCTGTLVTPRLVLTARHCIRLDVNPDCRITPPDVYVGVNLAGPKSASYLMARTATPECLSYLGGEGTETDLALVYLREPVPNVKPVRPAVDSIWGVNGEPGPNSPRHVTLTNGGIAGFSIVDNPGMTKRQLMTLPSPFNLQRRVLSAGSYAGFGAVEGDPPGIDIKEGDSGGPLFRTLPSGERQVVGVLSGWGIDTWWADIAAPRARAWITENALSDNIRPESTVWYQRHGKDRATMWYGEADYTGACDKVRDRDCDFWYDEHDNCPVVSNPDQEVTGPDPWAAGAACNACPFDPKKDEDNDGVCGPSAPGLPAPPFNRVDNCPRTHNPDQRNCNELSERTLSKALLGDACDPVPCPKVELQEGSAIIRSGAPFNPYVGVHGFGRTIRDTFKPTPVQPHVMESAGGSSIPFPRNATEISVANRFCQEAPEDRYFCITEGTIRNEQVDEPEVLNRTRPWHRIRTKPASSATNYPAPGTESSWNFNGSLLGTRRWGYAGDYARWVAQNLIPVPQSGACRDGASFGEGTCLDGYLWHHARTPIGFTQPETANGPVGIRGEDGRDLSNMFVALSPDQATVSLTKPIGKYRKLWWWQRLVDPLPPFLDDPRVRAHARPVALDEDKAGVVIHDIGGGEVADAWLSELMRTLLDKHIFAGSLEPEATPRQLAREVEGAIISDDGTRVLDLLVNHERQLALGKDHGLGTESEPSSEAPSPRSGFISFLSPALGGVVVAGGQTSQGRAAPSVHVYRFGVGWFKVNFAADLEDIRAAVYSPHDHMMWVLDAHGDGTMHIVRMNPLSGEQGEGKVLSWNASLYSDFQLSLDASGKVLLVASSAATSKTMRVEEVGGALLGTGRLQHEFAQHYAPLSAFGETSFVKVDTDGRVFGIDRSHDVPVGANLSLEEMFE